MILLDGSVECYVISSVQKFYPHILVDNVLPSSFIFVVSNDLFFEFDKEIVYSTLLYAQI